MASKTANRAAQDQIVKEYRELLRRENRLLRILAVCVSRRSGLEVIEEWELEAVDLARVEETGEGVRVSPGGLSTDGC